MYLLPPMIFHLYFIHNYYRQVRSVVSDALKIIPQVSLPLEDIRRVAKERNLAQKEKELREKAIDIFVETRPEVPMPIRKIPADRPAVGTESKCSGSFETQANIKWLREKELIERSKSHGSSSRQQPPEEKKRAQTWCVPLRAAQQHSS